MRTCAIELCDRFREEALPLQRATEPQVRERELRRDTEYLPKLRDRGLRPAGVVVLESDVGAKDGRERVERQRLGDPLCGFRVTSGGGEQHAQPVMSAGVARVERHRPQQRRLRALAVPPVIEVDVPEHGVSLRQRVVERQRGARGFFRGREGLPRRAKARVSQRGERVAQRRPRRRETRIEIARPPKLDDGVRQPLLAARARQRAAAQVVLERAGLDGGCPRRGRSGRSEDALHAGRDVARDLPLHFEDLADMALVLLRPEVRVGASVDELDVDAHAVAFARHRPFDHGVGGELFRDRRQRLRRPPIAKRGRARENAEAGLARELGEEQIGYAVGEVRLRGVARQVRERQHGHARPHAARRRGSNGHGAFESIAASDHGVDEPRRGRIVAERAPDRADGGVDALLRVDRDAGPEPLLDLRPRHQHALALDQEREQLHREPLERHRLTAATELPARGIELDLSDTSPCTPD